MELVQYHCPNCGGDLKQADEGTLQCIYCGSEFSTRSMERNAQTLSECLDQQKIEYVKNQRRNLYSAVHARYIDSDEVRLYATEIKKLLPDDFQANFYLDVLSGDVKKTARLIREINEVENYELLSPIIHFLIASLESEYHLELSNLIERAYKRRDLKLFSHFATELESEALKVDAGIYDTFEQRDVFIAYSSKDMDKVSELCQTLEAEGFTCFVAARNLRHGAGAVQNYDKALQEAMDNCTCFLFVSSVNSRSGSCDAVRKEIPYIRTMDIKNAPVNLRRFYDQIPEKYKMPRIEYRIDADPATSRIVTQFFDGYEWAYTVDEVMDRLDEIRLRYTLQDEWDEAPDSVSIPVAASTSAFTPAPQNVCTHQNVTIEPAVEATCTTSGHTEGAYCEDCGEILRASVPTPPHGHSFGKWKTTKQSTCTENGEQERVCHCGEKETKVIPSLGGHKTGEWETVKEPTEKDFGLKVKKCTVCGEQVEKQTIPKKLVEKPAAPAEKDPVSEPKIPALVVPQSHASKPPVRASKTPTVRIKPSLTKLTISQGLQYEVNLDDETCTITGIGGCRDKNVVIPETIATYRVTGIGKNTFRNCVNLIYVHIPASVVSIGESAFHGCSNLTYIDIPDSVTSIGNGAFYGCINLTSVRIPPSVTVIEKSLFWDCANLTDVKIPPSVTSIGEHAFYGCTGLVSVNIPNLITRICQNTFYGCASLTDIQIPDSVEVIDEYAFCGCSSLVNVVIPDSVTRIHKSTFEDCASLANVVIPDSVTSIDEFAFSGCTSLANIQIPDSVTVIGEWAFIGVGKISTSNAHPKYLSIDGNLYTKNGKTLIHYAANRNEEVFTVPTSVTGIGSDAFRGCTNLVSVNIPVSVTSIGDMAFRDCDRLENIRYAGTQKRWRRIALGEDWALDSSVHSVECSNGTVEIHH